MKDIRKDGDSLTKDVRDKFKKMIEGLKEQHDLTIKKKELECESIQDEIKLLKIDEDNYKKEIENYKAQIANQQIEEEKLIKKI